MWKGYKELYWILNKLKGVFKIKNLDCTEEISVEKLVGEMVDMEAGSKESKIEKSKSNAEKTFFSCSNYKNKFTSFLTNERIRNEQKLMKKYISQFKSATGVGEKALLTKKINNLGAKIYIDVEYLKSKYN